MYIGVFLINIYTETMCLITRYTLINNTMKQIQSQIASRIEALENYLGCSQSKFSQRCGIEKGHLSKMMNGHIAFSDKMLMRIAETYKVNLDWLRDGIGEMFERDKAEADAQYEQTKELVNGNVSLNAIRSDNDSGAQTVNATNADVEILRQRIEMLERLIEEKDKQINDKDGYIKMLVDMFGRGNVLK